MTIQKVSLCLNTDDPEQKELYDFITKLPNGKKRNVSGFLRTLVDREYQKKKGDYLAEKSKFEHEKKTHEAPQGERVKTKGSIKYLGKDINQNSD
ncbi:hypothetical protein [Neobacillus mesonae]|uniref:hypothetical protein n=1 Tax=Neobacillus mesonae TaxID=1193713 RepID=UPI00257424D3|nr:hypothetical protein [Neobacillus mesonae]